MKSGQSCDFESLEARWLNLAARLRSSEPEAAVEWVNQQWRPVWLLLRRRMGDAATPALARNALTDAMDQVRGGKIERPAQLIDWLSRWALRHKRGTGDGPSAPPAVEPGAHLTEVLSRCEPRERQALHRYYIGGQPAERIASDLGFSKDEFLDLRVRIRAVVANIRRRKTAGAVSDVRTRTAGSA
jgi:hypothetical protein